MGDNNLKNEFFFQGSDIGCLLIHGFTGTPAELLELGEYLNKDGYTVLGVKLKGHGTCVEDMEKCKYTDWISSAEDGLKKLQKTCSKIYVIGHSMGSLLALYIAENYDIDRVVALSPPLINKNKLSSFAFLLKHFIRYTEWAPRERPEEEKKYLIGYNRVSIKCVDEFNRLNANVRKNLKKITKPLLIIHSKSDETVDIKSVDILYNNVSSVNKKVHYLEKSGHNITVECEKNIVFEQVSDFLNDN